MDILSMAHFICTSLEGKTIMQCLQPFGRVCVCRLHIALLASVAWPDWSMTGNNLPDVRSCQSKSEGC